MLAKTQGIVLRTIPYNDYARIVHIYTQHFGRIPYLISRSHTKRPTLSKALALPLSLLDLEVNHHPHRDIQRLHEAKRAEPLQPLPDNPAKNAIALFIAEILFRATPHAQPDPPLFQFLNHSIQILNNTHHGIANFHLVFLLRLLTPLGVAPQTTRHTPNDCFDLLNASFTPTPPTHPHFLNPQESAFLAKLFRIDYANMTLYNFSRQQRNRILQQLLLYYQLHLPAFPPPQSLPILQSLFS